MQSVALAYRSIVPVIYVRPSVCIVCIYVVTRSHPLMQRRIPIFLLEGRFLSIRLKGCPLFISPAAGLRHSDCCSYETLLLFTGFPSALNPEAPKIVDPHPWSRLFSPIIALPFPPSYISMSSMSCRLQGSALCTRYMDQS